MDLKYLIFTLGLYPWLKSLLLYFLFKNEKFEKEYNDKKKNRTALTTAFLGSLVLFIGSIPYIGAYYYADLKSFWVTLGIIYFVLSVFLLFMGFLTYIINKLYKGEIEEHKNNINKPTNVNSWPKWQSNALCTFNYTVLLLWLYSWRHLIA